MILFFCITHSSWGIFLKTNFFISSMNFCCNSKKDQRRPYSALFRLSILPYLPYLGGILINTVLSRFKCTNALIASSYSISRPNLVTSASKTCKEVIARIVALIGKPWCFCWLSHTTNLTLHFWSRPYLSILYLKTH